MFMKKLILFIAVFALCCNVKSQNVSLCGNYTFEEDVQFGKIDTPAGSYGKRLYLGNKTENGYDPMWIARYNQSSLSSELRINIGDDEYDKFVVGSHLYTNGNTFSPMLTVGMNGRVGIGVLDPITKLDVGGDITFSKQISVKSYDKFNYIGKDIPTYGLKYDTDPNNTSESKNSFSLFVSSWSGIKFFTAQQSRLDILYNGNVGIGVANPQNKLDVNGTIHARQIKVDLTGWSDFVFSKNYQLPTLKDVKSHIDEKKHLPGIPSEAEVKENGIDVGEMQAKLLQKIEELTLYVIQQQETIDELNNKVQKLETQSK